MWKWSILCPFHRPPPSEFRLDQTGNRVKVIRLQNHFAVLASSCHEREPGYLDSK